ncbi:MAG: excinuclease ABC subunit UvrB [Promethearchaeota archaeon]
MTFELKSEFEPRGDQPKAIEKLVSGIKKGLRQNVLLGVTGSGKSLDYSEPVFVVNENCTSKVVPIGELVEKELKLAKNKCQKGETICTPGTREYLVLSLNPEKLQTELRPIVSFIKHRAPSEMYYLKTSCGRHALVTKGHNFYILRNGKLRLVRTDEIKTRDYLPLPLKLSCPTEKELKELDLLDFLKGEMLYIRGDEVLREMIRKYGRKKINDFLGKYFKSPRGKTHAIMKGKKNASLPLKVFKKLCQEFDYIMTPREVTTIEIIPWKASPPKGNSLKARLKINTRLLKLLGYYIAEGHSQKGYSILSNINHIVRSEIIAALRMLGWSYGIRKERTRDIVIHGIVYATLLSRLCGSKAEIKRLPYFWPSLSLKQLSVLLQAYFEGDGWIEKGGVLAVTKSQELASELAYALSRWGIWARIRETKKRAYNSKQKVTGYYEVSISCQSNLLLFAEHIGFRSNEKNDKLKKALNHTPHSNVDVIPGCGGFLKETRQLLHLYTTQLGKRTSLSHNFISMCESGKRNPTRKTAEKLIREFKERVKEIKKLDLEYLKFWAGLDPDYLEKAKKELLQLTMTKFEGPSSSYNELFEIYGLPSRACFRGGPSPSTKLVKRISSSAQSLREEQSLPNPLNGFAQHPFEERGKILLEIIHSLNLPLPASKINPGMRFETLQKLSRQYYALITSHLQKAEDNIAELEKLLRVRWTPVISISKTRYQKEHVYDIAVKENETFLAGSGGLFLHNTFTVAHVIDRLQLPAIIIEPNKTLAAQIVSELRRFFPDNAVEYFVSYYDYYQPEAYVPPTDTYIGKDFSINEEVERLRLSAAHALVSRKDVIVVATVSCMYPSSSPEDYKVSIAVFKEKDKISRKKAIDNLVDIQYERNDFDFKPGAFRVRGDILEIFPPYSKVAVRLEFFGDEIEKISEIDPLKGTAVRRLSSAYVYSAKYFTTPIVKVRRALATIEEELESRLRELRKRGKIFEAERLEKRTRYDLEMLSEMGYCSGIENYSRHLDGRKAGEKPSVLLDFFPEESLMVIDESHITIPQIKGMYWGDNSRKKNLVDYGFRLPSAYDNRPLTFDEFEKYMQNVIYVSATPGPYAMDAAEQVVEQIIRPTGLVDPRIIVKSTANQIDDLVEEIKKRIEKKERTLVTTLTKRMAEKLSEYLVETGTKAEYLHSEIDTLDRIEILRNLRLGKFDTVVGINLLREGLDLPEVSLVAILDADKEGFLRSERSLIQIMGRASRNINGTVILYADDMTKSMKSAIDENNRRRALQLAFNEEHGIVPKTIVKPIADIAESAYVSPPLAEDVIKEVRGMSDSEIAMHIVKLKEEMKAAADNLEFELAAELRDKVAVLESLIGYASR